MVANDLRYTKEHEWVRVEGDVARLKEALCRPAFLADALADGPAEVDIAPGTQFWAQLGGRQGQAAARPAGFRVGFEGVEIAQGRRPHHRRQKHESALLIPRSAPGRGPCARG